MRKHQGLFHLLLMILVILGSCKEKNDLYPPVPWSVYFIHKPPTPIASIFIENSHTVWLGTQDNTGLLYNNAYEWALFNHENTGIAFDSVTDILKDGNGIMWIAWKRGLASFDGETWKSIPELEGRCVTSIVQQGIGIIWVGYAGGNAEGGIGHWNGDSWKLMTTENSDLPSSHILCLAIDKEQNIYAGTADKGVIVYNGFSWKQVIIDPFPEKYSVNSLAMDQKGIIWAGTSQSEVIGLVKDDPVVLNTGTGKPITSMHFSASGPLWIGTSGAGLLRVANGEWRSCTSENMHLPDNIILTIAEHPLGQVLASYIDGTIVQFNENLQP